MDIYKLLLGTIAALCLNAAVHAGHTTPQNTQALVSPTEITNEDEICLPINIGGLWRCLP